MARATRPLMVRPPIQEEFVDLGVNPFAASTGLEGLELTDEVVDAIVGNLLRDRDSDSAIRINGRSYDDTSGDMMEYLLGRVGNVRSKEAPIFTTIGEDVYITGVTPETPPTPAPVRSSRV